MGFTQGPPPPEDVDLRPHDGWLEARFRGPFSAEGFNHQMDLALRACRERDLPRLLVDTTALIGMPSTLDRFQIGVHGADAAKDLRKAAVFALPAQIDPKKFGAVVARNRGLQVDVFSERAKALDWLLA